MVVEIPRGGTEYVGDPITVGRGSINDILTSKSFHTQDPTIKPIVADFVDPASVIRSSTNPLWAGVTEVVTRVGPRGEVTLAPGDWQRWVLLSTADEDIIEATGVVTIT